MPFGFDSEFKDWDACVKGNSDKDNPEAYCGWLKKETETANKGRRRRLKLAFSKLDGTQVEYLLLSFLKQSVGKARHSRDTCMDCNNPPETEVIWADGRARAWFCDSCLAKWESAKDRDIVKRRKMTT